MKAAFKILGILCFVLLIILGVEFGCSKYNETNLNYIENKSGIKYLSNGKIEYYFDGTNKFLSDGYKYYVITFDDKPTELLNQKYNEKEEKNLFVFGIDKEIENIFNNAISILNNKNDFKTEYTINFKHEYYYMTNCDQFYALYDTELNKIFLLYETSFIN